MHPSSAWRLPLATFTLRFAPALAALVVSAGGCSSPSIGGLGSTSIAPSNDNTGSTSNTGTSTGSGDSPGNGSTAATDDAGTPIVSSPAGDDAGSAGWTADAASDAWWSDASWPSDASDTNDAEADADVDAGPVVNGCTAADFALHDESGAAGVRTITFANAAPATQYDPNCMRIASGQSVTWKGDLKLFPLDPFGGTTPTPIKKTDKGTTVTFAFATAGTYGFESSAQAKVMFGAIDVLP